MAGNGTGGEQISGGDGGPATSASVTPNGVTVDSAGNIYIADVFASTIRKVNTAGIISTVAGYAGEPMSFNGDGVPATKSSIYLGNRHDGLAVDKAGNLYIADYGHQVTVTTSAGTSSAATVTVGTYGPAFFSWPNNQVVATYQDFTYAVANGTFSGTTTTPAKPGDTIILWGTGFGPTNPTYLQGEETPSNATYNTATLPTVTINNVSATVYGAALAPGFAGLYQVAIQVPASLGNGNWPVVATIGGVSSPNGLELAVQ